MNTERKTALNIMLYMLVRTLQQLYHKVLYNIIVQLLNYNNRLWAQKVSNFKPQ